MAVPADRAPDSTLALFGSDGYDFISKRCRKYGTDLFATRLMLRKAFCMLGAEAAAQFYHPGRFTRKRALPLFALTLIQDLGSVMVQDAEEHRRRKAMFLSLMTPAELERLSELTASHWRAAARRWQGMREISLFDEAHVPYARPSASGRGLSFRIAKSPREHASSKSWSTVQVPWARGTGAATWFGGEPSAGCARSSAGFEQGS